MARPPPHTALGGGAGADRFVFLDVSESGPEAPDAILDFASGEDRLDLSALAPMEEGGLAWIGRAGFVGGAGEVRAERGLSGLVMTADLDGDARADLAITLQGLRALGAEDLIV